jgi:hypothetical protein
VKSESPHRFQHLQEEGTPHYGDEVCTQSSKASNQSINQSQSKIMYHIALATVGVAVLAVAMMMQPVIVLSLLGVAAFLFLGYISYFMTRHRQAAAPEARQMLVAHVQKGLAARSRKYDLYVPSAKHDKESSSSTKDKRSKAEGSNSSNKALMFLPGALVDHTAYAAIAIQLAERHGILVAVVSLEPTRLANSIFGVTTSKLVRLSKEIEGRARTMVASSGEIYEWSLGGHSLVSTLRENPSRFDDSRKCDSHSTC